MLHDKRLINQKILDAAAAKNKERSEEIVKKLLGAMRKIDEEIEANEGVYPKGRISAREVCRRASVHYQTLSAPAHKDSTKRFVEEWIAKKKTRTVAATKKVAVERIEHWKEQHHKVASQIAIYELELNEKDIEITELRKKIATLEAQMAQIAQGKLMPISSGNQLK